MNEVESKVRMLGDFIREKNQDIVSGSEAAIKELESKVAEFCKYALALPYDEISAYRSDIEFLAEYLKKVAVHLNLTEDGIMRQIQELNARKRAAHAYASKKLS